jgi:hypothetical protein
MQLGFKIGALMLDSAQVIAHRTRRIAAAGAFPGARDRRESTRMVQEKFDAAFEATHAMAALLGSMSTSASMQLFERIAAATSAYASLASSRNASDMIARHQTFLRSFDAPAPGAMKLSHSMARLAHTGLAPIHARASANAKRLRKR